MPLPDIFDSTVAQDLHARIGRLTPSAPPLWGRMDAAQMLAHCCIPYEQLRGSRGGGPLLVRWIGRVFFKNAVVGERPFRKSIPTPRSFVIADAREFEVERERLLALMGSVHREGRAAFEGRAHVTFGVLSATEWSNLMWKHLDHHLRQFGA